MLFDTSNLNNKNVLFQLQVTPNLTIDKNNDTIFPICEEAALNILKSGHFREWTFLIPCTRAEDFWQGYETSLHYFVEVRIYQEQISWDTKQFCWKTFG